MQTCGSRTMCQEVSLVASSVIISSLLQDCNQTASIVGRAIAGCACEIFFIDLNVGKDKSSCCWSVGNSFQLDILAHVGY